MSLRRRTRELSRRMTAHLNDAQDIENTIQQNYGRRATRQMPYHRNRLRSTKIKADELVIKVEERENAVESRIARLEIAFERNRQASETQMRATRSQLNRTQHELKSTQSELLELKTDLHTGQTAYNFERDLACYIYPRGTVPTYDRQIFTNLMTWLWKNRTTREGRKANNRWNALKREFGWSYRHKSVFHEMLDCRREAAHPRPVDHRLPISERFARNDKKKYVEDIRKMTVRLNELIRKR